MFKKGNVVAGAAALVMTGMVATPAMAHDGLSVGLGGLFGAITAEATNTRASNAAITYTDDKTTTIPALPKLTLGYDYPIDNTTTIGLTADYTPLSRKFKGTNVNVRQGNLPSTQTRLEVKIKKYYTVALKVGVKNFYADLGMAGITVSGHWSRTGGTRQNETPTKKNLKGFTTEIGHCTDMSTNMNACAGVSWTHFGTKNITGLTQGTAALKKADMYGVTLRFGYAIPGTGL